MPSLGNDLASIREQRGLSIEDVHHSIKIPVAILKSIEDDSIFTTLDENVTYIRSYIRSYARALKIDNRQIIRALDQTENGQYSGFLIEQEEDRISPPVSSDKTAEADKKPETSSDDSEPKPSSPPKPAKKPEAVPNHTQRTSSVTPTVNTVDWVDMGRRFSPLQTKSRAWIIITFLVLILAATAAFVVYQNYYTGNSNTPGSSSHDMAAAETTSSSTDSLQLNLQAPVEESQKDVSVSETTLSALPDTLTMIIYAAYDILEPVRVYTDVMDSLNPYWIEHEEAYRFDFVNTIRIRGQYSRMELMLNGHIIENFRQRFYNNNSGMLEIDRNIFENDPKWLQPPDSLGIDVPPPTKVKDRPTYN